MGFINAAVNELMYQPKEWPAAHSLDAADFADHAVEEIRWLLGINEEEGRQVAIKLWLGLRNESP